MLDVLCATAEFSVAPTNTNTTHAMNLTVDVNFMRCLFTYITCMNTFQWQIRILTVQWVPGLSRGNGRPRRDADPSPPSSAVGHERVELYLYSPYGPYGLYRASLSVQGWPLPLRILTTHAWCTGTVHLLTILLLCMSLSHFWYSNIIISLYFNCKREASVLPFYITAALPDNGRDYRPKHVAVNAINKYKL